MADSPDTMYFVNNYIGYKGGNNTPISRTLDEWWFTYPKIQQPKIGPQILGGLILADRTMCYLLEDEGISATKLDFDDIHRELKNKHC